MLFNSFDFAVFLPIVFFLYWFVFRGNLRAQNALVVVASYVFYGWWDWRFLSLIIFSTLVDYVVGLRLKEAEKRSSRLALLWTSIAVNLGFLGFFKYYNFFLDNFNELFTIFGYPITAGSLNIILPVGISFYTFQTLSYTIDVYRKKLEPTNDFVAFSAFVSFFPQLVAGPIERATNLLPQFYSSRSFDYSKAVDGLRQILWGLFKKIVIADNCAEVVNRVFANPVDHSGSELVLAVIFFTFQIYGDFSGYSDIAIGTARLFGFNLMQNFAFPYFSRDIAEFWRRWHISLSTWFRDYLYIPLGGSKGSTFMKVRNTFAIFIVSGFWHGANWTFIIWGFLNALYFLPLLLMRRNRMNTGPIALNRNFPSIREFAGMMITFTLTMFAWLFFRAESMEQAISMVGQIFSSSLFYAPHKYILKYQLMAVIALFLVVEWIGRNNKYAIETLAHAQRPIVRLSAYYVLAMLVLLYSGTKNEFIYFQF